MSNKTLYCEQIDGRVCGLSDALESKLEVDMLLHCMCSQTHRRAWDVLSATLLHAMLFKTSCCEVDLHAASRLTSFYVSGTRWWRTSVLANTQTHKTFEELGFQKPCQAESSTPSHRMSLHTVTIELRKKLGQKLESKTHIPPRKTYYSIGKPLQKATESNVTRRLALPFATLGVLRVLCFDFATGERLLCRATGAPVAAKPPRWATDRRASSLSEERALSFSPQRGQRRRRAHTSKALTPDSSTSSPFASPRSLCQPLLPRPMLRSPAVDRFFGGQFLGVRFLSLLRLLMTKGLLLLELVSIPTHSFSCAGFVSSTKHDSRHSVYRAGRSQTSFVLATTRKSHPDGPNEAIVVRL
eukprot:913415-Amphidinium_carterae.1